MTAVEWLLEQLETKYNINIERLSVTDKAKAMDKEQKEYFFNCGRQYQLTGEGTFTEVYNETYKID